MFCIDEAAGLFVISVRKMLLKVCSDEYSNKHMGMEQILPIKLK